MRGHRPSWSRRGATSGCAVLDSSALVKTIVAEQGTEALRAVRHLGPQALARVREALRRVDLAAIDDLRVVVTYDERMIKAPSLLGIPTATPA